LSQELKATFLKYVHLTLGCQAENIHEPMNLNKEEALLPGIHLPIMTVPMLSLASITSGVAGLMNLAH
jgi:hypothetical protein